ncbi:Inner membrane protein ytfF [Serratia rubidaea]|uniref:Inner membrane protein ytfF n=1 Tax=Serratia rubidaea TaxID=61652 RepID=A0A4U9HFN0_SERRU|nr:Inner membrane protein ytfF [Serratia rubidaea]
MFLGIMFALSAGLLWGLIFVGPLIVPDYPAALQSTGRYLAFGLIALPLAWLDRQRLKKLRRRDWLEALKFTAIGNLLYYLCLASAIQRTGAPISTMIIGTLPVVMSVTANLCYGRHEGRLSWRRLTPALLLIALGWCWLTLPNCAAVRCRWTFGVTSAVWRWRCWR